MLKKDKFFIENVNKKLCFCVRILDRKHNNILLYGELVQEQDYTKKYSARLTGNQFLYNEFKVMIRLVNAGLSRKELTDKIINENLFEYRSLKSIGKHIGAVYERANYLDEELAERILTEPNEVGRLINFYAILKYDLLFLEFVEDVVAEKIYTHQTEISRADISNFFSIKAEQSEIVLNFKEATLKRLRLAYFELLLGAGYLVKNNDTMELNIPTSAYQISAYLESVGEKRFAKAMIGG